MIKPPRLGRLTQGTVFCGAKAGDYLSVPTWGVIITARCDTAQEKTPLVNYLPLVRVEDWLERDGGTVILDRALSDLLNRFKALMTTRDFAASLLEVYSPSEITAEHFALPPTPGTSKKVEKELREAQQAADLAAEIAQVKEALADRPDRALFVRQQLLGCRKWTEAVIKELFSHRLAGYYFIPDIGDLTDNSSALGYVVLLREIHHIPRPTVSRLVNGVAADANGAVDLAGLCFKSFDFACPVTEIQSPWIEHLMQAFCSLFGRIGIVDLDKGRTSRIVNAVSPN